MPSMADARHVRSRCPPRVRPLWAVTPFLAVVVACAPMPRPDAARPLSPPPRAVDPGTPAWTIDPVHTRVLVAVDHLGVSTSLGALSGATGTLWLPESGWRGAAVDVALPLARLDFGDAEWNTAMQGGRWLDVPTHPEARFVADVVDPRDESHATVRGRLTLRGVTREVALDVRRNATRRHPLTLRRMAGFSASATLDRRDFGLTAFPSMVGTTVDLRIEVEATR